MKINSNISVEVEPIRFRYGKYKGQSFNDCRDFDYMCWYIGTLEGSKYQIEDAAKVLVEAGCKVDVHQDKDGLYRASAMTRSAVEKYNAAIKDRDYFAQNVANGKPFEVIFKHNCNYEGKYYEKKEDLYIYKFNETRYVDGRYPYTLPIINGKGRKINGNKFTITKYTTTMDNDILVVNIEEMMDDKEIEKINKKAAREAEKIAKAAKKAKEWAAKVQKRMEKKAAREAARLNKIAK